MRRDGSRLTHLDVRTHRRRRSRPGRTLLAASVARLGYRPCLRQRCAGADRRGRRGRSFDVALVDLGARQRIRRSTSIRAIKAHAPDTEIVVISASTSLASRRSRPTSCRRSPSCRSRSTSTSCFGAVERARRATARVTRRSPAGLGTADRQRDRRRACASRWRPSACVERRARAPDARRSTSLERFDPPSQPRDRRVRRARHARADRRRADRGSHGRRSPRPSDLVLATRAAGARRRPARADAASGGADLPVRRALSVPMFAGEDLIGVLSDRLPDAGPVRPSRRAAARRSSPTRSPSRVQNARLHDFVRARQAGVGSDLRRDRRRDRGVRSPRPAAARQHARSPRISAGRSRRCAG